MATIHYARLDEFWRKEQKYDFLDQSKQLGAVAWQELTPNNRHVWLTSETDGEFASLIPLGSKDGKSGQSDNVIFRTYSRGVATNNDAYVYNFNQQHLIETVTAMIEEYHRERDRWNRSGNLSDLENFLQVDEKILKWIRHTKRNLLRGVEIEFEQNKIRIGIYRPFSQRYYYFERVFNEDIYGIPYFFPTPQVGNENQVIWVKTGSDWPMFGLMVNKIPDLLPQGGSQCFPFYTYAEDGSQRRENITDWALAQFQQRYAAQSPNHQITKWDIFHYVYALLHHPDYRAKYAANLRRELPRIPLVEDFWGLAQAGAKLAKLHVHYEEQPEYRLELIENPDKPLDWRVERMKLSKDRASLVYNDFLTLRGILPAVYEYKLGNRSALEWVIDQYQVSTDKRSGIRNDPNNPADPQYIVRLIGQVITVSLSTVEIVNGLPPLQLLP